MKKVLVIAGVETSGGAGLTTDVRTVTKLGTYAATAVTCMVSFDANYDHRFIAVEKQIIKDEIEGAVNVHGEFDAVKIGMLGTNETIDAVAESIDELGLKNIVLDPVLICKGQDEGLSVDDYLAEKLFSKATVLTPNLYEAKIISQIEIDTIETAEIAAKIIRDIAGGDVVVIKCGDKLKDSFSAIDVVFDGFKMIVLESTAVKLSKPVSGAGCSFASAVATNIANKNTPLEAIEKAKIFVSNCLKNSFETKAPFLSINQL
jgi:pyridoxine kinase